MMKNKNTNEFKKEARLTTGNRVTIPKRFRDSMGLKPGDFVAFKIKNGYAEIIAVPQEGTEETRRSRKPKARNEA